VSFRKAAGLSGIHPVRVRGAGFRWLAWRWIPGSRCARPGMTGGRCHSGRPKACPESILMRVRGAGFRWWAWRWIPGSRCARPGMTGAGVSPEGRRPVRNPSWCVSVVSLRSIWC